MKKRLRIQRLLLRLASRRPRSGATASQTVASHLRPRQAGGSSPRRCFSGFLGRGSVDIVCAAERRLEVIRRSRALDFRHPALDDRGHDADE